MAESILVVDDEPIIRESISYILRREGYTVREASNGQEGYDRVMEESFDVVITDLEMPEMRGIDLLERIMQVNPRSAVVIITAYGSLDTAISALRKGASDYILKPVEFEELLVKVRRLVEHRKLALENQYLRRELHREYNFAQMVGKSRAMESVFEMIGRVSGTDSTVLISGTSGTGKELVARAVHFNSRRSEEAFITVNCGAITETLIESELFGHKKGSFTGAVSDKTGYFKTADGGTLFLDEVSEMPLQLQVKLLRAIEQKEITPVGSSVPEKVNVRIIAATNRNLKEEVEKGKFRGDLYYRLNVVELHLPSLKERKEDIPLLVEHFVEKYRREMRKDVRGVDGQVMQLLMNHEWKGEIRELENIVERAMIFADGDVITIEALPEIMRSQAGLTLPSEGSSLQDALRDVERQYIHAVLRRHSFDKEATASELGISVPTLYRRIKELGILE